MSTTAPTRRSFTSYSDMFRERRIPVENRDFIAAALDQVERLDITELVSYVKITRANKQPDIRLYRGYIGGYTSEAEALRMTDAKVAYESETRPGTWWVWLPEHGQPTPGSAGTPRRARGGRLAESSWLRKPCPVCRYLMNEAGKCTNCRS
ncbi:hypothetical protein EDF60_0911 [Leucobacter luti]|uniref:hypothetical protein n=1 Tax=Leucobacter luti TaxID=340320 RepID=UPI00104FE573|nr:hypothetical protein [Leucobacter luti]MCW2288159.1 hypothetical protein [Leucobacter luti]TCK45679.1 hypothetical protein EDF60_0911 [Leucobacter luti]